ncbi:peptide MFS transporter [Endozoicomonadaceae bacterium StTr2]
MTSEEYQAPSSDFSTCSTNTPQKQPQGFFHLISILMWEYFSYYGMRALLILYLTSELLFSDGEAYALYGAYTAMVYVTPVFGGMLADRYLGNRWAVILGALFMVAGHLTLGFSGDHLLPLYLALSLIIIGYGLFKTNISCLLGELYTHNDSRREPGFALMYVGGNLGAVLSGIGCGWVAHEYGWHAGFGLAALGMLAGLVVFLTGHRHFITTCNPNWRALKKSFFLIPQGVWIALGLAAAVILFVFTLKYLWAGYLLTIAGICTCVLLLRIYARCNPEEKKELGLIICFMLFGVVFWAFCQQGGSSINLFIDRNINREIGSLVIPTPMFQSINPISVLLGGVVMAWLWKLLTQRGIEPDTLAKQGIGMVLLTIGFALIAMAAKIAQMNAGQAPMLWLVVGIFFMGVAELFIDPVALASITRLNPAHSTGTLAGIYMLLTGSFANFLAGHIAMLAEVDVNEGMELDLHTAASTYFATFSNITLVTAGALCLLVIIWLSVDTSKAK